MSRRKFRPKSQHANIILEPRRTRTDEPVNTYQLGDKIVPRPNPAYEYVVKVGRVGGVPMVRIPKGAGPEFIAGFLRANPVMAVQGVRFVPSGVRLPQTITARPRFIKSVERALTNIHDRNTRVMMDGADPTIVRGTLDYWNCGCPMSVPMHNCGQADPGDLDGAFDRRRAFTPIEDE